MVRILDAHGLMKIFVLVCLLAISPMGRGEIKFVCSGESKIWLGSAHREFESEEIVWLQNEYLPFTLRNRGQRVLVNLSSDEEYYLGSLGEEGKPGFTSMSIHRMTLKFYSRSILKGAITSFSGTCDKAEAFEPKI